MKNPFSTHKPAPVEEESPAKEIRYESSLIEDVQDILQTKGWWEEKGHCLTYIQLDSGHCHDRVHIDKPWAIEDIAFFGDDEAFQSPAPDMEPYNEALRIWHVLVEEFKSNHPVFYGVWSLGKQGLVLTLEALKFCSLDSDSLLQDAINTPERGPYLTSWEKTSRRVVPRMLCGENIRSKVDPGKFYGKGFARLQEGRYMEMEGPMSDTAQTLFGDMLTVSVEEYTLRLQGAQTALANFEGISRAYEQQRERGQAILENWAAQFAAALSRIEEEQQPLQQYFAMALERYESIGAVSSSES